MILNFASFTDNFVPIFLNDSIRYKGKTVFDTKWVKRGFKFLHQLLDCQRKVIDFNHLPQELKALPDCLFTFNALKNAIEKSERLKGLDLNFEKLQKISNVHLRNILDQGEQYEINGRLFWLRKFGFDIHSYYISSLQCIKETKLKVLLFKIYHKILPTKVMLKKWKLSDTEHCDCGEKDLIEHSLIECSYLNDLWEAVSKTISIQLNGKSIPLTNVNKLFGISSHEQKRFHISKEDCLVINNILIIAKFSINKSRALKVFNYKTCFDIEWQFRKPLIVPGAEEPTP